MKTIDRSKRGLFLAATGIVAALCLAYLGTDQKATFSILAVFSAAIFVLSFFSVPISLQVLFASMLLSPEIQIFQTPVRDVNLRMDDITLTIMVFGWLLRMAVLKDTGFVLKNPLNRPIVIYCAIIAISTTMGVMRGDVFIFSGLFFVLKLIEFFLLYIIIVNYVNDLPTLHRLLTTLLFVFAVVCLYGLFQIMIGGNVSTPFEGEKPERNTFGGYVALMGAIAAGIMLYTDSDLERRLILCLLPLAITVLLFSISRSGWASAITVMIVLLFLAPYKNVYFMIVLVLMVTLPLWAPDVVRQRLAYTFSFTAPLNQQIAVAGAILDPSTSARLFSWMDVLKQILKHPFLGYGVTGFGFIDGQFFRTLIELGIMGLAALLWLFARTLGVARSTLRQELPRRIQGMTVGFIAGFWGLMVHSLTANSFMIVRIAEPFWCLAGLVMAAQRLSLEAKDAEPATEKPQRILSA